MNKNDAYNWANKRIRAQVERAVEDTPVFANTAAILKEYFPNMFWVGFYFTRPDHLVLGPFQGPPACVKLSYDKGVCAAAVRERRTILVPNVHEFPGHVACDSRSQSEVVVPIKGADDEIAAVLDVDGAELNAFDETDVTGLEAVASQLSTLIKKNT